MRKSDGQARTAELAGAQKQQKTCRSRTGKSQCRTRSDVRSERVKQDQFVELAKYFPKEHLNLLTKKLNAQQIWDTFQIRNM